MTRSKEFAFEWHSNVQVYAMIAFLNTESREVGTGNTAEQ